MQEAFFLYVKDHRSSCFMHFFLHIFIDCINVRRLWTVKKSTRKGEKKRLLEIQNKSVRIDKVSVCIVYKKGRKTSKKKQRWWYIQRNRCGHYRSFPRYMTIRIMVVSKTIRINSAFSLLFFYYYSFLLLN